MHALENPLCPRRAGFTLLEMLIVLAILAILTPIIYSFAGRLTARQQLEEPPRGDPLHLPWVEVPGGVYRVNSRLSHEVGRGMPKKFKRIRILARGDGHFLAIVQRSRQVHNFAAIHPNAQGRLGQLRPDAFREGSPRGPVRQFTEGVVGKADRDGHGLLGGNNRSV